MCVTERFIWKYKMIVLHLFLCVPKLLKNNCTQSKKITFTSLEASNTSYARLKMYGALINQIPRRR